jgi:chemotaxis protein MotA
LAKTTSLLAIVSHIERPEEISVFQTFPRFP